MHACIKLDDLVRDDNLVIKFLASKVRNKMNKILPERLNQFITTANQRITDVEKSDVDLEQYLYSISKMGGQIFHLATPTGSSYDKDFVIEAGMVSAKLMVMDDMGNDLSKDMKSGRYNPLKDAQTHSKFNRLYANAKNRLEGMMNRVGIERTTPTNSFEFNSMSSDGWGQCLSACFDALPKKYQDYIIGIGCCICCPILIVGIIVGYWIGVC